MTGSGQQPQQRSSASREELESVKSDVAGIRAVMTEIMEQLKAISKADEERMRPSREQELRGESTVHELHDVDDDLIISHPSLKAREGMAQKWIRVLIGGETDSGNILRMRAPQRAWNPRHPDTLPKDLARVMSKTFEGESVIQYRDLVLHERPIALDAKESARKQSSADMQLHGVEQDLRRVHEPGQTGFGAPAFAERKRVAVTGRRPEVE